MHWYIITQVFLQWPGDERHNSIIEEYGVSRSLSNPILIPVERISSIPDVDPENHNHDTQVASTHKNDSLHSENIPNIEDKVISEIADDNISSTTNISISFPEPQWLCW